MVDDQDRCEWMNASSGTGSPRLSQTKSREPKNGCSCSSKNLHMVQLMLLLPPSSLASLKFRMVDLSDADFTRLCWKSGH